MDSKMQHVVPHENGWAVIAEGAEKASAVFPSKEQAEDRAREIVMSNGGKVVLHKKNGKFEDIFTPRVVIDAEQATGLHSIHIVPRGEEWAVTKEGNDRATKVFDSKYSAIRFGHKMADHDNVNMIVHNRDGTFSHVDTPPHFPSPISDVLHMR